ncbi:hypothetical protein PILCRDRAFT_16097 [Piloderma croceum F 1598]|uniref:Uncharacterized protein n=1 Tax=Piloderma croceum (strain F 1598) TaxID=765440 RepID=A0A0C3EXG8_PILCF|nr:hypothetical protein PILCRDRAFT_16097 [Piloderma croceum F 1598]
MPVYLAAITCTSSDRTAKVKFARTRPTCGASVAAVPRPQAMTVSSNITDAQNAIVSP